jgi:hypothetical protein
MEQYIKKSAIMAEIRKYIKSAEAFLKYHHNRNDKSVYASEQEKLVMCELLSFLDTLEVKESDETAEAFARIIRANLTGIDKDVQYKFEQLYKEITGEKMYQGYND